MSRVDNIFNKLIDFRFGNQEEYDQMVSTMGPDNLPVISDEDLYFVDQDIDCDQEDVQGGTVTLHKLYMGLNLIGDSYNSQYIGGTDPESRRLSIRVTNPIGLIPYGLTLANLLKYTTGSISRVIDMMLFTNASHSINEVGIIYGFIPKIDTGGNWQPTSVCNWISDYVATDFDPSKWNMFFGIEGNTISTTFKICLDPEKSEEEYNGSNTGMYTGRMFVAIPRATSNPMLISTIVDRVFSQVYTGQGLETDYIKMDNASIQYENTSYAYTVYLFGADQSVNTTLAMEYSVLLAR